LIIIESFSVSQAPYFMLPINAFLECHPGKRRALLQSEWHWY